MRARTEFFENEMLSLRWRGPRRVVSTVSDNMYSVEDFPNNLTEDLPLSRFKLYEDSESNAQNILSYVIQSEARTLVHQLMALVDTNGNT